MIEAIKDFLEKSKIPFDILSHPPVEMQFVKSLSESLSVPKSMLVRTVEVQIGSYKAVALLPGNATLNTSSLAETFFKSKGIEQSQGEFQVSAISGVADDAPPLTVFDYFDKNNAAEIFIDNKLLEVCYAVFPTNDKSESVRIDSRFIKLLNFHVGDFSESPSIQKAKSGFDILLERGFVDRATNEERARQLLNDGKTRSYIGFDPTADSLHVGSLVPIMALAHLQRAGHPIIALVGGATALIGDPSGKTEMRKMLTIEQIDKNLQGIKKQLSTFLSFDEDKGRVVNNADWLANKGYLEFLREVGVHFSVNRMLTAECFKSRMDKGLSFIEFNYMLLQAYDFFTLSQTNNCLIQMGGSDQWGNICAGVELTRRAADLEVSGITFPLLMNSSGRKFGKTEAGNIWLDKDKTTPYEYFQFWRNTEDTDLRKFLQLFTFLPIEKIREITSAKFNINLAKKFLAFATTSLVHGEERAIEAATSAESMFGGDISSLADALKNFNLISDIGFAAMKNLAKDGKSSQALNQISYKRDELAAGLSINDTLVAIGFADSKSAAKRLIEQGGVQINDDKITDFKFTISDKNLNADNEIFIRAGKKRFGKIILKD